MPGASIDVGSFFTILPSLVNNYGSSDHSEPEHQPLQYQPLDDSHDRDDQHLQQIQGSADDTFVNDDEYHVEVGYHGFNSLDDGDQFGVSHPGDDTGEYG